MRSLKLKLVTVQPHDRPSVKSWVPGLRNVPLDVTMGKIKGQLQELGVDLKSVAEFRSGLLESPWNGFPQHALVIATGGSDGEGEQMAISE